MSFETKKSCTVDFYTTHELPPGLKNGWLFLSQIVLGVLVQSAIVVATKGYPSVIDVTEGGKKPELLLCQLPMMPFTVSSKHCGKINRAIDDGKIGKVGRSGWQYLFMGNDDEAKERLLEIDRKLSKYK